MEAGFSEEMRKFGKRTNYLRKHVFKIKQKEFAELCGISLSQLSRIENGKQNFEFRSLVKLGYGFRLELLNLFDYENKLPLLERLSTDVYQRESEEREALGAHFAELRKDNRKIQLEMEISSSIWTSDISRIENAHLNMKFLSVYRLGVIGLEKQLWEVFNYVKPPAKPIE